MGINSYVFDIIGTYCKREPGGKALVAGYPDFVVHPDILLKHLGREDFSPDEQSTQIMLNHNEPDIGYSRDPREVFAALGYETMAVIDFARHRGIEVLINLNGVHSFGDFFDLVIDHGTIEHCFNIAQAAMNLATALKLDGQIVQHLPLNMFNHGFYNLNPTWFYDFYSKENGFEIVFLEGWCWKTKQKFPLPPYADFISVPDFSLITVVAKRTELKWVKMPIQRRYQGEK